MSVILCKKLFLFLFLTVCSCHASLDGQIAGIDLNVMTSNHCREKTKASGAYALEQKSFDIIESMVSSQFKPVKKIVEEATFDLVNSDEKLNYLLRRSGVSLTLTLTDFIGKMSLNIHRLKRDPEHDSIFQNEQITCDFVSVPLAQEVLQGRKNIAELSDINCKHENPNLEKGFFSLLNEEFRQLSQSESVSLVSIFASLESVMVSKDELTIGLINFSDGLENLELRKSSYPSGLQMFELRRLANRRGCIGGQEKLEFLLSSLGAPIRPISYSRSEVHYLLAKKSKVQDDLLKQWGILTERDSD